MAKKTVSVGRQLAHINWFLSHNGEHEHDAARRAMCTMAEIILFESGNYRGFTYLMPYDEWNDHSIDERRYQEYRRQYFISDKIMDDYNACMEEKRLMKGGE